jgi:hypothetical protein
MAANLAPAPEAPHSLSQEVIDVGMREAPMSISCPPSKKVMTDPVLLVASGHNQKRATQAEHFEEQVSLHPGVSIEDGLC